MYDWIWRRLPGNTAAKAAQAVLLAAVAAALLFRFGFPAVESRLPWNRTVVRTTPGARPPAALASSAGTPARAAVPGTARQRRPLGPQL